MQIISKKRYLFRNGDKVIITEGQGIIQSVPDWVAETPLYAIASAGGNIIELATKGRTVTEDGAATKAEVEQATGDAEAKAEVEQATKPAAKTAARAKTAGK